MKLNLTYVKRDERVSVRTNKPFTSISIKAKEYGEKYLSGFGNKDNANWKEGMEVEVAEVKEVVKDGKTYLNFEMPKAGTVDNKTLDSILYIVQENNKMLKEIGKKMFEAKDDYPTPESQGIGLDNAPF